MVGSRWGVIKPYDEGMADIGNNNDTRAYKYLICFGFCVLIESHRTQTNESEPIGLFILYDNRAIYFYRRIRRKL